MFYWFVFPKLKAQGLTSTCYDFCNVGVKKGILPDSVKTRARVKRICDHNHCDTTLEIWYLKQEVRAQFRTRDIVLYETALNVVVLSNNFFEKVESIEH